MPQFPFLDLVFQFFVVNLLDLLPIRDYFGPGIFFLL